MYRMVFAQILCRVILFTTIVVISSCSSYRLFEIEALQPAVLPVGKGKKVALLDRGIRLKDTPVVFTDTLAEQSLSRQFTNGINYVFTEAGWDTVIPAMTEKPILISHIGFPESLPFEKVNRYCDLLKTEYLLSIEFLYYVYEHHIVQCNRLIRLYQYANPFPLDSFTLSDTLPPVDMLSSEEILSELEGASWDQGAKCAKRMVPYWEKSERRVYNREKLLKVGDVLWQEGDTEQALKIWKGALQLGNKIAVKAGINLAWFYEDAGDLKIAFSYLEEAEKLAKKLGIHNDMTTYLSRYKKLLKQRVDQKEVLDQQLLSD